MWRGGLGGTYLLATLSVAGASLFPPCFHFHTPLIEPDVQIYRIRLSEKTELHTWPMGGADRVHQRWRRAHR